jgi:diacylglycerol kinase family enzyme
VIRKGEPWGHAPGGTADIVVSGDDATLAAAITAHPRARVAFRPSSGSDFARAVGISAAAPPTTDATSELPCDLLRIRTDTGTAAAVNMAILGVPPDRQRWTSRTDRVRVTVDGRVVHEGPATAVVIANGQYLRGADVVPRGHPGDGRAEVHVYALTRSERRGMRARLPRGEHVPHPRITVAGGRTIVVDSLASPFPVELDGVPCDRSATVTVEVTPSAFSLLL